MESLSTDVTSTVTGPAGHYFPPFAEARITWIESAQPKMPIVHFCKKILDWRAWPWTGVPPVHDPFTECDDRFFL
jgi:hypothetical protein